MRRLTDAVEALERAAGSLMEFFMGGKIDQVTLVATPFLEAMAEVVLGHLLLEAAVLAETKRLLADHPDQVDGLYNIGAIYANQGNTALARQYWTKAVAADPESESGRKSADALTKISK